jgi:hypothetical protein
MASARIRAALIVKNGQTVSFSSASLGRVSGQLSDDETEFALSVGYLVFTRQ